MDIELLFEQEGVFITHFPQEGWKFTWRLLTRKEYRVLRGLRNLGILQAGAINLEAFKRAYAGEYRLLNRDIPAGVIDSVGGLIMYLSGDCQSETIRQDVQIARQITPLHGLKEHMERVILIAFPSYTPDDLDEWTRPKFMKMFVKAENKLLATGYLQESMDVNEISGPGEGPSAAAGTGGGSPRGIQVPNDLDVGRNAAEMGMKPHELEDALDEAARRDREYKRRKQQEQQGLSEREAKALDRRRG